ncbi:hypothetical protein [Priestia megaterium]|uniref:hypothetical protein n=1 Tax=Priestia megaterium TaxID=1404 RepID=UPI00207A9827|nr:hypothetical protein [Priestia megaterium]USL45770.1 hypothetical protein LIS78_30225 [Priestia megaterium]
MGSNGFSSEKKRKRVDLLKLLLDTNISTQGSSNPLDALLSDLDLGSLEGLMQKNKKSHHDDWDSKKKRHHDDCSDHDWDHKKKRHHDDCGCDKKKHDHHDWDHKKKHDHDDCGCSKKKHDHDDCGCSKKKHDHDDCGCKKKKHDHDDCGCKKKKRCKCCPEDTQELRRAINAVCRALNAQNFSLEDLQDAITESGLEDLLDNDCIDDEIADDLLVLITAILEDDLDEDTLVDFGRRLNDLRRCLGLRVSRCSPRDGGGGNGECTCDEDATTLLASISALLCGIISAPILDTDALFTQLDRLRDFLETDAAACIRDNLRNQLERVVDRLFDFETDPEDIPRGQLERLAVRLRRLRQCLGLPAILCPGPPSGGGGGGGGGLTIREQLLDLVTDQVVITTPTAVVVGTLVTVQLDYIAVVDATGTTLIPLDEIEAFTTE